MRRRLRKFRALTLALSLASASGFGQAPVASGSAGDAETLLAKAAAAFRANEARQKHWNWQTVETRELVDRSGKAVQRFPSVTSESVIRSDGRRCNAVVAGGDGRKPYLANADPDERCRAMDATAPPFPPIGVL